MELNWTRSCYESKYLDCIYGIQNFYSLDATHEYNVLNGINDQERELYDTFEDEFDCLDQYCPWEPTDTISGETVNVSKALQFAMFNNTDFCIGGNADDTYCDVDLRTLIDNFVILDPDQFMLDLFEIEVIDQLKKPQEIRVIFELKEEAIKKMETSIKEEEADMLDEKFPGNEVLDR